MTYDPGRNGRDQCTTPEHNQCTLNVNPNEQVRLTDRCGGKSQCRLPNNNDPLPGCTDGNAEDLIEQVFYTCQSVTTTTGTRSCFKIPIYRPTIFFVLISFHPPLFYIYVVA